MRDPVFVVEAVKFVAVVVANILVPVALRLPVLVVPKFPILAKRFWNIPVTELIRLETIESAVVVPVSEMLFREDILLVEITPLTFEVKVLVVVAYERLFEFTKFVVVVDMTPFTLLVSINAFVVVATLIKLAMVVVGILVVEVTPFMVEVNT